jgi:hypothetical protein
VWQALKDATLSLDRLEKSLRPKEIPDDLKVPDLDGWLQGKNLGGFFGLLDDKGYDDLSVLMCMANEMECSAFETKFKYVKPEGKCQKLYRELRKEFSRRAVGVVPE